MKVCADKKPMSSAERKAKQRALRPETAEQKAAKIAAQKARRYKTKLQKAIADGLVKAKTNPNNETAIQFVGIDGEAVKTGKVLTVTHEGKTLKARESFYVCLQAVGSDGIELAPPLVEKRASVGKTPYKGLSTESVFEWLLSPAFRRSKRIGSDGKPLTAKDSKGNETFVYNPPPTLVGFYLNYDFQNWICDLSPKHLKELSATNETTWHGYKIKYIPKKIFEVTDLRNPRVRTVKVQDYAGYFPGSFIGACEDSHLIAIKKGDKWLCDGEELLETDERVYFAKVLESGKADRTNFDVSYLHFGAQDSIMEYNRIECLLMARMMTKLANTVNKAFPPIHVNHDGETHKPFEFFEFEPSMSYGAGALANAVYKSMEWKTYKPDFNPLEKFACPNYEWREKIIDNPKQLLALIEKFPEFSDKDAISAKYKHYQEAQYYNEMPFFKCFFGGRIESAAMGEWKSDDVAMWAYDVNSAYPAAIYKMPDWKPDSIRRAFAGDIPQLLEKRVAGMVHIEWSLPEHWVWYPFPYRNATNVYFPALGKGWVTLLEFYAFVDSLTVDELSAYADWIKIDEIVYLEGTDGRGDGLHNDITFTGQTILKLYNERAKLKASGDFDELAFKIALNSFYGKLVQQIGVDINAVLEYDDGTLIYSESMKESNLKNLNSFAASWVTGFCRAMIWRAIAPVKTERTIVAVQTDGIYSLKHLPYLDVSKIEYKDADGNPIIIDGKPLKIKQLGLWDVDEYKEYCNLMPGIYRTVSVKGKVSMKVRGMPKKLFDFDCAKEVALYGGQKLFQIMSNKNLEAKLVGLNPPFNARQMKLAKTGSRKYTVQFESFVQHELAMLRPDSLKGLVLQWVEVEKEFKPSLTAKRRNWKLDTNIWEPWESFTKLSTDGTPYWTLPKFGSNNESTPYDLKFGVNGDFTMMEDQLQGSGEVDVLLCGDEYGNYSLGSRRE
jgi:hypothetical protein